MSLPTSIIKNLHTIIGKGMETTRAFKPWMEELVDQKIGYKRHNKWHLEAKDLELIEEFLESKGYLSSSFTEEDKSSRKKMALKSPNEKIGKSVTHDKVLIQYCGVKNSGLPFNVPANIPYVKSVSELKEVDLKQVVLVENLDTFLEFSDEKEAKKHLLEESIVMYRGGLGFSVSGPSSFLKEFHGEVLAYFDFDPSGLTLHGHGFITDVLMPDLNDVLALRSLKREWESVSTEKFYKQISCTEKRLIELSNNNPLSSYAKSMLNNKISMQQELISILDIKLHKIRINNPISDYVMEENK
jgi:hypothetical protein